MRRLLTIKKMSLSEEANVAHVSTMLVSRVASMLVSTIFTMTARQYA